jgi:hypothetical protein
VTILWAGRRAWSFRRLYNLYVFPHALVAVRASWAGIAEGAVKQRKLPLDTWLGDKRDAVEAVGDLPVAELLDRHPENRRVPWAGVTEARLRKGWLDSRLTLMLDDGTKLRWVWTRGDGFRGRLVPNPPLAAVESALRETLGLALAPR